MPAGRPPKPTSLKILTGNPGKRPLPEHEPKPAAGAKPPKWLRSKARLHWRRLAPMLEDLGVLTVADESALALLCDALAEYLAARAVLDTDGMTYAATATSGDTLYRPRPEVAIAADAWRRASAMLGQFGLTPSARVKVQAFPQDDIDPMEALLSGHKRAS